MEQQEAGDLVARVETLLEEVEALADPAARDKATEVAAAVLELYGEGMARIVTEVAQRDGDGELAAALAGDELVSHLLLLHGLHPVPLEARVQGALDEVRPYLDSHGGNVELIDVQDGVAHLRMEGSCSGCPSSAMTLKLAIEKAIHKAAPDVEGIEAEGTVEADPAPGLLQLEVLPGLGGPPGAGAGGNGGSAGNGHAPTAAASGEWTMAGGMPELRGPGAVGSGGPIVKDVGGQPLLFLKAGESLYAYRPGCPACGGSLADAALGDGKLTCPGCANRYDARRAGRCLDSPELHLEPIPLLEDQAGLVKVALGSAA